MQLGLDLGTTNVKAAVVDDGGKLRGLGHSPVERFCTPDGGVVQNIEDIWSAAVTAVRQATLRVAVADIHAVGVSSQGAAIQLLNHADRPLGRTISWLDSRGQPFDAELTAALGREYFSRRIGHGSSGLAIGQLLRMRRLSPHRLDFPNRIGFVGDVIVGRLCGRRAHDPTSLGIALLYNPWLDRPDPEILDLLGLRDDQLPDLLPATVAAGKLTGDAAGLLGLTPGIPVSPAIHDQYTASLGAGAVVEGHVNLGAGTAWVLLATVKTLAPPVVPESYVCKHPVEGLYGQMLSMRNGGSAIDWALSLIGKQSPDVAVWLDEWLDSVPPGSEGLRFWPLLSGSLGGDGADASDGRMTGMNLAHGRPHLLRAVIEGLACELARHLQMFTGAGLAIGQLTMCGRAAAGRHTPQIIASVTNLPVCCIEASEVSALGAAIIARKLTDPDRSLVEISQHWAPPRRIVHPETADQIYSDLLRDYLAPFKCFEPDHAQK